MSITHFLRKSLVHFSKCHLSNSEVSGYIMIGRHQGRLLVWISMLRRFWCWNVASAEESRFADETVNNDADVLFCPVDKILQCWGEKRAMLYLHLSLFFCRETPVKQENQAHRETLAPQYGKKQNKKTLIWKALKHKKVSEQHSYLISRVCFRVQEESEEKRENPDPLVLLGPPDLKDHQEMMVLKEALYVLIINYLFGVWKRHS